MPDPDDTGEPPIQHAFIGIWSCGVEFRFGPYPPTQVGAYLERLMRGHEGEHSFFVSIQCDPVADPVPHLLELARKDEQSRTERPSAGPN